MDVSSRAQRVEPRKPRQPRRYRVAVRGALPNNLADIISGAHAAALKRTAADDRVTEGDERSAIERGFPDEVDSTTRSQAEIHHE